MTYRWESRFGEGAVPGGLWDKEMHALAQLQGPSSEGNLDYSPLFHNRKLEDKI